MSFFGSMITFVAVPYQVYQLTRSSLAVGLLGGVELAAVLGFAFLGGALADARDRRRMVLLTEVALTLTALVLVANSLRAAPLVWVLFGVAGAQAALEALQRPSLDALLPRLVPPEEMPPAIALSMLRGTAGLIAGPAAGGILIAAFGLPRTYLVDMATFVISLACLAAMRAVPPPPDAERASVRRVMEGLRYARSRPELVGTYVVDICAMFFGMPIALFPAIAAGYGGAGVLGAMYAAPAVGSLIANATSGWSSRVHRHGRAVILAAIAWGAAIVAFGFSRALVPALVFLALAGGADSLSGLFRGLIWNQTIPDSLRGRLASIEMISYNGGPALGNVESGVVASIFNVRVSVISGGFLCVVACGLCALLLPDFRRYDSRRRLTG